MPPIYDYECYKCGKREDAYRTVDERNTDAPRCHGKMKIVIGAARGYVQPDFESYISPASGEVITSRQHRQNDMAKTGSRPWEGMKDERAEAQRRKAYDEAKADAKLEETVRKSYHQMHPDKRRILES